MHHHPRIPSFDDFVVLRRSDLDDLVQKVRVLWNSAQQNESPLHFSVDQGLMSDAGVAGARIQTKVLSAAVRKLDFKVQDRSEAATLLIPPGLTEDVVEEILRQVLHGVGHACGENMTQDTWETVRTRLGRHGIAVQLAAATLSTAVT